MTAAAAVARTLRRGGVTPPPAPHRAPAPGTAAGLLALGAWWGLADADGMTVRAALRPHRPLLASVALLLAWLTLSLTWADDPGRGGAELVRWYVSAVALVVMLSTLRTVRDVRLVIGA